jgi:CheY-like chemotaxis protein
MHSLVKLEDITVVIAEDDGDIRFALTQFLCRQGAKVFPCANAEEALEAVRVNRPDIVLSDIGLPKRDGFQLLEDIRSLNAEQGRHVPVIAMTAYDWSGERARRLWGTFEAHLDKPFKPDQLLSAVVSTLDHRVAPE